MFVCVCVCVLYQYIIVGCCKCVCVYVCACGNYIRACNAIGYSQQQQTEEKKKWCGSVLDLFDAARPRLPHGQRLQTVRFGLRQRLRLHLLAQLLDVLVYSDDQAEFLRARVRAVGWVFASMGGKPEQREHIRCIKWI